MAYHNDYDTESDLLEFSAGDSEEDGEEGGNNAPPETDTEEESEKWE
ncbi:MAG: hypothetical protein UY78_C0032G0001 [Parcubacteria group bacterium GW2011_GWA1_53_13]|nr:MAG: hypothetical protein UY78_C0032G0001 [Parcubacteria group bacterium GW2011_GWA1_53_13]